jgi:glycosyltransferase involved in cell wall biosynthesis
MNFFFISEHYEPRIGGVTTYIRETCKALAKLGHNVTLAVPGEQAVNTITERESYGFLVLEFGSGIELTKAISSNVRVRFTKDIHNYLIEENQLKRFDVVHNLFGLYLMQYLDLSGMKNAGKPVGVTVHNIPPEECGVSWKGDDWNSYYKDIIRKELVRFVNKRRIQKQDYDYYVVPSRMVKDKLSKYITSRPIHVIGHGGAAKAYIEEPNNSKIQLLTVAGFVPHKNQHFIPEAANKIRAAGVEIEWNVVGPNKHSKYVDYIQNQIKKWNVKDDVKFHFSVSYEMLVKFYQNADLYVQMSSEEGFCITTLDASFYGIPIIGTRAGAIPEIIENSSVLVVDTNVDAIADGIIEFIKDKDFKNKNSNRKKRIEKVTQIYSWKESAKKMVMLYTSK